MTNIMIPKGTLVQGKKGMVELKADVYVEAEREVDGAYSYSVGRNQYFVSAGCIVRLKD